MQDFDWNDLKAFLAVVRTGRLTIAAKRLQIDHSTLSRQILGLETALGAKLFDRRSAGYALTLEGEHLIAEAEAMENLAVGILSRLDDPVLGLTGCVRIGMPEGFGTYFLAPRLERFTAQHPQLEVEIVANPRMFSLSKREAEIAVTMTRPQRGRLHARKLTDYELGLYACRSYLKKRGPIEHRLQIASHPWIGYIKDLIWTSELDYFVDISKSIVPRVKISNVITQMTAILGGIGLGVLPCFMANREPDLIRLLPKEIRIVRSYWLVIHSDVRDLVRVKAVADFVADRVQAERQFFWAAGEMPCERKPL